MSKLLVGLLLYAVGIVVFAQSGIGMAPWDVLSRTLPGWSLSKNGPE